MKTYYKVIDGQLDLIGTDGLPPEGYTECEVVNKTPQLPEDLIPLYDARLAKFDLRARKEEAKKKLTETDWVEPYILKHNLNIEVLPEGSEKLAIDKKRQEWKALVSS